MLDWKPEEKLVPTSVGEAVASCEVGLSVLNWKLEGTEPSMVGVSVVDPSVVGTEEDVGLTVLVWKLEEKLVTASVGDSVLDWKLEDKLEPESVGDAVVDTSSVGRIVDRCNNVGVRLRVLKLEATSVGGSVVSDDSLVGEVEK